MIFSVVSILIWSIPKANTRQKLMTIPNIQEEKGVVQKSMLEKCAPEKAESKQRRHKDGEHRRKDREVVDKYYKSIVSNNLFRPLGWVLKEKKRGPDFRLIGTVITQSPQALIFEFANNATHYVTVGDKIGSATVKSISEKSVMLKKDSEEAIILNILRESPFIGVVALDKGRRNKAPKRKSLPHR